jgi:hypothetical protein
MNAWILVVAGGIVILNVTWVIVEAIRQPIVEDVPHQSPDVAAFNYGWESEYLRDWEDDQVAALDAQYGEFIDERTPLVLQAMAARARKVT